jgi:hypothetical protein
MRGTEVVTRPELVKLAFELKEYVWELGIHVEIYHGNYLGSG